MKKRWLGSLAALLLGNGLALAQVNYLPPADAEVLLSEQDPTATSVEATPASPKLAPVSAVQKKSVAMPAPSSAVTTLRSEPVVVIPSASLAPTPACGCEQRSVFSQAEGVKERDRVWANAEYLVWWLSGNRVPALVGTLPAAMAGQAANLPPGAITTVFGDRDLDFGDFSGGRFTAGVWLDKEQYVGLEGSFFFLNRTSLSFNGTSAGDPIVGPLFFDITAGRDSIITPVTPGRATETAHVATSERLWGSELNVKTRLCYFANSSLDVLTGFRYMDLRNDLSVNTATNFIGNGVRAFSDAFAAKNQFYGGQIGAALDLRGGPWSLGITGKLGIGGVQETVVINGFTTETPIGFPSSTFTGGILTHPSNIGHFSMTRFAILPEMSFLLGYQVTDNFRLTFGYNFLYLSKAVYPGNAIDSVNPSSIRGLIVTNPSNVVRPIPITTQSDLWANGLSFGAEVRF
jgi:hypothetical protein